MAGRTTLLLSSTALDEAITGRTAAGIVVHLYGQMADMTAIGDVARRRGIVVIEDAAQAHGARWDDRGAGTFGVAGCFSFYPGKNLGAMGDGGAVVIDDDSIAGRIRSMANQGRSVTNKHEHPYLGTNSRLDGLQAGVLRVKLPHLASWNQQRRAIASRYREELGPGIRFVHQSQGAESVHHLEVVRVAERDSVRERLARHGVGTGIHYPIPVHRLAPYTYATSEAMPVSEQAADEILSLPMFPGMTADEVEQVVSACRDAVGEVAR